jgi:hypothetical protein
MYRSVHTVRRIARLGDAHHSDYLRITGDTEAHGGERDRKCTGRKNL